MDWQSGKDVVNVAVYPSGEKLKTDQCLAHKYLHFRFVSVFAYSFLKQKLQLYNKPFMY